MRLQVVQHMMVHLPCVGICLCSAPYRQLLSCSGYRRLQKRCNKRLFALLVARQHGNHGIFIQHICMSVRFFLSVTSGTQSLFEPFSMCCGVLALQGGCAARAGSAAVHRQSLACTCGAACRSAALLKVCGVPRTPLPLRHSDIASCNRVLAGMGCMYRTLLGFDWQDFMLGVCCRWACTARTRM